MKEVRRIAAPGLALAVAVGATALGVSSSWAQRPTGPGDSTPSASSRTVAPTPDTKPQPTDVQAKVWVLNGNLLNVRRTSTADGAVISTLKEGDAVTIRCQVRGDMMHNTIKDRRSDLWNYVPALGGYVADAWVDTGTPNQVAPTCAAGAPSGSGGTAVGPATGKTLQVDDVVEGQDVPTQSFGVTRFSSSHCDIYWASPRYGLENCAHDGVDRGGTYRGAPVLSPVDGVVEAAGGTGYFWDAKETRHQPGVGELRIRRSNGDVVVLGHLSSMTVKQGQQVTAGQRVGGVGSIEANHLHLGYRIPDRSTPSGFRVVDPNQKLGCRLCEPS